MRNLWKASILVILIIVGILFFYLIRIKEIRENILVQLEKELKFCEIVRDEMNVFSGNGKFWLICNGRPFYMEYQNNFIRYELNGWGWLKNTEYWNELKDCGFYDMRNSHLIFYCKNDGKALFFLFKKDKFTLEKLEEKSLKKVLEEDVKSVYDFLKNCELTFFKLNKGPLISILILKFKCQEGNYTLLGDLNSLSLPVFESFDAKERISISLRKVFNLLPEAIADNIGNVTLDSIKLIVSYPNTRTSSFLIEYGNDLEETIKKFGNYFIFPPLKLENLTLIGKDKVKKEDLEFERKVYRTQDNFLIEVYISKGRIFYMGRVSEDYE